MTYWVYVLKSKSHVKSYVGHTNDLERRLVEHNTGKNFYTKRHMPWEIFHKEEFSDASAARIREKFLKTPSGRRFLKMLFNNK
jgi:putative endonuclease